jgi:hypothetical protein
MKRIAQIPNLGNVAFPDHMSDQDVSAATQHLHAQANPKGIEDVIQALVKTEKGPSSKTHEKMASVAQVLEQTPALLQLAIAGLSSGNQPATGSGSQQPESQAQPQQPQAQTAQQEV